ncbi:hypothetical protein L218DRAFT_1019290 [Marasmius fiardii PR-910]|nr:hypothetical protein L218DRAFT_1019290 [Marasmius fiardii PR-910]
MDQRWYGTHPGRLSSTSGPALIPKTIHADADVAGGLSNAPAPLDVSSPPLLTAVEDIVAQYRRRQDAFEQMTQQQMVALGVLDKLVTHHRAMETEKEGMATKIVDLEENQGLLTRRIQELEREKQEQDQQYRENERKLSKEMQERDELFRVFSKVAEEKKAPEHELELPIFGLIDWKNKSKRRRPAV